MDIPIKYAEWHPVGVCDSGLEERRKTRFFKKNDLTLVNGTKVNRGNWRNNKEVIAIIHRYAQDVAELSPLTAEMIHPVVGDIRLVGAVTQYAKTPDLNEASEEGKIQFFQVSFEDQALLEPDPIAIAPPSRRKHWLLLLFALGGLFFLLKDIQLPSKSLLPVASAPLCSSPRGGNAYRTELQTAQQKITAQFADLPAWSALTQSKENCSQSVDSLEEQELQVVRCYLRLNRNVQDVPGLSMNLLLPVQQCITRICSQSLAHLSSYCRQL